MPHTATANYTLTVPGARLYYEVRGAGPLLLLIGAPMDSSGFALVAPLLADDYTVVTYDPRGISRSTCDDPGQDLTPEILADDVHRLLSALRDEPAFVFGSSGGGITGLALVHRHPDQVRTLIAHEPPVIELLPDNTEQRAGVDEIYETYLGSGPDAAMAKFFTFTGIPVPPGFESLPPEAKAATDLFLGHMLRPFTRYRPDIAMLQHAAPRVVVGGGTVSRGQLAHRTAVALAGHLGTGLVDFPGDHGGFASEPAPFAHAIREVLTDSS
jgi:clorobiocin/coumermycin A biosynthesis protein CloN7/CouN7